MIYLNNFKNILFKFFLGKIKRIVADLRGFCKNPFFCFVGISLFLLGLICFSSYNFFDLNNSLKNADAVFFNSFFDKASASMMQAADPFLSRQEILSLETPDLKIMQDNSVCAISTPRVLTTQVLGAIFGEENQQNNITEYSVQPGDTLESIAQNFNISLNTLLWANNIAKGSTIKVGQSLVILPVSGVVHVVKSGDTISEISKTYKAKENDVIAFNNLSGEGDIFIGDILVVPGGIMPQKQAPSVAQTPLADNFFIFPVEGKISQGLHWYNAVDVANKCGTPVYAAASGIVQRVKYGWNFGGGNYITILHSNGVVTYYGHLMTIFVNPGDRVDVGDKIALVGGAKGMAGAGISTGCHLHFEVVGAKNPLSKYLLNTQIKYSK
jgi:murein DD-endopeptidase MepM/ murein hydrolase activator NlpD